MIRNFLYEVCGAAGDWTMGDYKETAIRQIREKVGDGKVLLALSGGVDSSVAAALVAEAVGSQLTLRVRGPRSHAPERGATRWRPPSKSGTSTSSGPNAEDLFLGKLAGVHGAGAQAEDHR